MEAQSKTIDRTFRDELLNPVVCTIVSKSIIIHRRCRVPRNDMKNYSITAATSLL